MNNTMNMIASIFTGKGGTLRTTIIGAMLAALIYEVMDARYGLNVTTKEGSISFSPAGNPAVTAEPGYEVAQMGTEQQQSEEAVYQEDLGE